MPYNPRVYVKPKKRSKDDWDAIIDDAVVRGLNVTEAAALHEVSRSCIHKHCKSRHVLLAGHRGPTQRIAWEQELRQAEKAGLSQVEFSRKTGFSKVTVWRYCKIYGVKLPDRRYGKWADKRELPGPAP